MMATLSHRGPDGDGFYKDSFVGFGHRRLSVIDLSPAAAQPMLTRDKRFVITYNGEVYNFNDLKNKLKKQGVKFSSNSDTEVVLNSLSLWGKKAIDLYNGMFAFALWDKQEEILTLARDRYGIKPLYYWQNGSVFLFASEIKAFLKHPEFRAALDPHRLLEYFTFQNIFTDNTLFAGVKIIPPGTYATLDLKAGHKMDFKRYWDFHFEEENNIRTEKEYCLELDRLFKQAVKRQLVSDVEIGSYLSGGIDSGSITAISSGFFKELKTFCIGFDLSSASGMELSFDERQKAEHISYLYQTEHYEMVLKSGDMKRCLPNLVWSLEDLRLGQSYPNFYASKLASRFVKVCLSGAGGDELFAGYPWRYYRSLKSKNFQEYIDGYYKYWQRLAPNTTLKELFSPLEDEVKGVWTRDIFESVYGNHKLVPKTQEDYINHSLYFEAKTFLHGLLIVEDKLSMANGLEVRVPFLDNDLVDFALKIPVKMKLRNIDEILRIDEDELAKREKYFQKIHDGKIILRKAFEKYVGKKVVHQQKQGFSGPDASWFKGESIDYVKKLLLDRNANIYDFMDYKTAKSLIYEHIEGKHNHRLFIWSLLCFENWLELFL
jgi:asparagine synthase (glutamine-hydrolysing)